MSDHLNGEMCKRCLNPDPRRAWVPEKHSVRVQPAAPTPPLPGSPCPGCGSKEAAAAESFAGLIE